MAKQPIQKRELPFSITARTALLLGRESISNPVVAVLELVKNAYDADANNVTVRFRKASTPNGTIEVLDNGHGMTWEDIETKWMVIGTDNKQREPASPGGRTRVGEKGIGRFALDRLASQVIVETTPMSAENEDVGSTYRLTVDWSKFENTDKSLHEVLHPVEILERRKKQGTRLLLRNLRDRWTRRDYERLYNDLAVLIPPFESKSVGFGIRFECDEAEDISGRISRPMAKAALFKIRATLDKKNQVKLVITTRDGSTDGRFRVFKRYRRSWKQLFDIPEDQPARPQCGPVTFELYFYLRDAKALEGINITLGRLRDFLDIYTGVRIYRDDFRIKSYGDPGGTGDWLGLSARREQHPGGVGSKSDKWVVGANQVVAGVFISRTTNPDLRDQTNRQGLFDNQAFRDMRSFVLKCIEIFETDRKAYEMKKRSDDEEPAVEDTIEDAKQEALAGIEKLETALNSQPDTPEKNVLAGAVDIFRKQVERLDIVSTVYEAEQQEIVTRYQLLQNLATIGIAVSSMGHEVLDTSRQIMNIVRRLKKRLAAMMLLSDEKAEQYMERLHRYGRIMYSVSQFALGHIDRDKRHWQKVNIDSVVQELYRDTLEEMCDTNKASLNLKLGGVPDIYAFPYEIESIIINFVTNSLAAFRRGRTPTADRIIEIETKYNESSSTVNIITRDSGPGIPKGDSERIFNIYSTKIDDEGRPIGTGLGLAIVKDIVESHDGTIKIVENGSVLPGAEFIVTLPVPRRRGRRKEPA